MGLTLMRKCGRAEASHCAFTSFENIYLLRCTSACGTKARAPFWTRPALHPCNCCKLLRRMLAAPKREPHFEHHPPSIPVTVANVQLQDHKRQGSLRREPHLEKEPPSILGAVAHFKLQEHKWRGSIRRESHFETDPPSILVTVGNFKLQDHKWQGSLRREPHFEKEPPSIPVAVANF